MSVSSTALLRWIRLGVLAWHLTFDGATALCGTVTTPERGYRQERSLRSGAPSEMRCKICLDEARRRLAL